MALRASAYVMTKMVKSSNFTSSNLSYDFSKKSEKVYTTFAFQISLMFF